MARYIDADEALRMMRNSEQDNPYDPPKKGIWEIAHDCCISCVDAVPTADVVEVKHGEWKASVMGTGAPHCSLCNGVAPVRYIYCPHCGAKMDGGKAE